jgi:hypothetical protein
MSLSIVFLSTLHHPPFLLISSIFRMINTRNSNANVENSNTENNNATNPPPPPPLTLEQDLVLQAQLLQTMQQIMVNM